MSIPYQILSKAELDQFPIKQHLGHKFIGVEPDLILDFFLLQPRIFLRTDLVDVKKNDHLEVLEAGYFTAKQHKLFRGFSLLRPQRSVSTIQTIEEGENIDITQLDFSPLKDEQPALLKVHDHLDVLVIHHDFLKRLSTPSIADIEFRIPK